MKDSSFVRPGVSAAQTERESTVLRSSAWRTWLFGRPLPTADEAHEAISKPVGLAVFSSDALSSTAYATQEILHVLAYAGLAAFALVFPISLGIVALLALVTISKRQTIYAYPGGGGAYIVARDNLGTLAAQSAGAALLMDYVLTVAVSMSSGVAQIVSARVDRHRVILALSSVHRGTVAGLHYARAVSEDVTAVYVSTEPELAAAVQEKWGRWGAGVRLVIVHSPYRLLIEPLLDYIRQVAARRQPNEVITIVVPQFVPRRRWHNVLHAQTAMMLRLALMFEPGIVITSVPYQVGREGE